MGLRNTVKRTPPNLRRGNARQRCGLCQFFQAGKCAKYGGYPVRPTQLSDSFQPKTTR